MSMRPFFIEPDVIEAGRIGLLRRDRIRMLNDELRTTFEGGKVIFSPAVQALSEDHKHDVLLAVRLFWQFNPEDDPFEEHDLGAFTRHGVRYMWLIDYLDLNLRLGVDDPSDPHFTIRVLTILRCGEFRTSWPRVKL